MSVYNYLLNLLLVYEGGNDSFHVTDCLCWQHLCLFTHVKICISSTVLVSSATLAGLSAYLLNNFQSVLNAAARSIAGLRRSKSILQMLLPVFTGYEHSSALSSSWWLLSTGLFMAQHLSTYQISCSSLPICRRDAVVASVRRLPVFSTSVYRDVLPSVIDRLLLPALDFGTLYLSMFSLLRHSQHFAKSWKLIYFGSPTQTTASP